MGLSARARLIELGFSSRALSALLLTPMPREATPEKLPFRPATSVSVV